MRRLWPLLLASVLGCDCQPTPKPMDDGGIDGLLEVSITEFGEVLRGDSLERPVTFKNTRSTTVELTLSVSGAGFSLMGPTTLQLPSGGESTVQVRFSPAGLGRQDGALTYVDGAPEELALIGTGVGPALELTPAAIELGVLPLYDGVPATAAATLTARNLGLDGAPPRDDTALQLVFAVLPTSAAPGDELCVWDCMSSSISVPVEAFAQVPLTFSSTTPGVKTWDLQVLSNDPTAPMRTLPVTAEVVARPTCQFAVPPGVAFGLISSPEARELEVVLENVGTENCEIERVELSDPMPPQTAPLFSVVNAPSAPQLVAPGELLRVLVRAAPQGPTPSAAVSVAGELRFTLNHPDAFARVPLTVQLGPSCLLVTPTPVDFGAVQTGCSAARTVSLRNTCSQAIEITGAALPGFSSFSMTAALPAQLLRNQEIDLTAGFTPVTAGPSRDAIDVTWTQLGATRHTIVPLVAEANSTGQNLEQFPAGTAKLDLLLVIDDSASFMDKVANLDAQLPRLLTALASQNVDFRLGVIDANADGTSPTSGVLRRTSTGLPWLTPSTPSLAARFAELTAFEGAVNVEGCEDAVLRALTAPVAGDPARNGGFLRPDSMLSVVCITDTTDESYLVPEVLHAAGPGRRFTWDDISMVGPATAQCSGTYALQPQEPTLHAATGGRLFDICATDWSPLFDELASRATGRRTFFHLRGTPDLAGTPPLSVSVSGQSVSATALDGGTVWTWESTPNAVVFSPPFAPLASQPVTISYPVACMP